MTGSKCIFHNGKICITHLHLCTGLKIILITGIESISNDYSAGSFEKSSQKGKNFFEPCAWPPGLVGVAEDISQQSGNALTAINIDYYYGSHRTKATLPIVWRDGARVSLDKAKTVCLFVWLLCCFRTIWKYMNYMTISQCHVIAFCLNRITKLSHIRLKQN